MPRLVQHHSVRVCRRHRARALLRTDDQASLLKVPTPSPICRSTTARQACLCWRSRYYRRQQVMPGSSSVKWPPPIPPPLLGGGCSSRAAPSTVLPVRGSRRCVHQAAVPLSQRRLHPGEVAARNGLRRAALIDGATWDTRRESATQLCDSKVCAARHAPRRVVSRPAQARRRAPGASWRVRTCVSAGAWDESACWGRRASVTRITKTCATQRHDLLVKSKVPSSCAPATSACQALYAPAALCQKPRTLDKPRESRLAACRRARSAGAATRLQLAAHASFLEALSGCSLGHRLVRLPPSLLGAAQSASRASARAQAAPQLQAAAGSSPTQ